MIDKNRYIKNLRKFEGKRVFLLTKALGLKYTTSNLKVLENSIRFNDKYGNEVMISIDDIDMIVEVEKR